MNNPDHETLDLLARRARLERSLYLANLLADGIMAVHGACLAAVKFVSSPREVKRAPRHATQR